MYTHNSIVQNSGPIVDANTNYGVRTGQGEDRVGWAGWYRGEVKQD